MSKRLNIEVRGIGFPNKGAELMLAAICDMIYARYPFAKIVLPPVAGFRDRAVFGVYQLGSVNKFGYDFGVLLKVLPARMRNLFGIVMPSEIDAVIDASGFAYGDQWGEEKAKKRLGANIVRFKAVSKHRKVIMMPQAMGPFSDKPLANQMRTILRNCDLVFARDSTSLRYAREVCDQDHIKLAPDFTNLLEATYQGRQQIPKDAVCFIPNNKMLEMKPDTDPTQYVSFMSSLIKAALALEQNCYVLVHEGIGDVNLANAIATKVGEEIEIIQLSSTKDIKAAIGKSKLVISSRFHGLVSALSQGVPVIATGWSHKYQSLLQDYGVGGHLYNEQTQREEALLALRNLLTNDTELRALKSRVLNGASEQKQLTEKMWLEVFPILDKAIRP